MYFRLTAATLLLALVLLMSMCTVSGPTVSAPTVSAPTVSAPSTTLVPSPTVVPTRTPTVAPTATWTPVPGERQEALVLRVVDGDTIVVQLEGKRYSVRYIGIDTPETHHPTEGADYLGFEAGDANKEMVHEGETVVLQRDISEADHYGRLLRYVWVGETLVNAELVRMGLARVLFYEPDVLYQAEIEAAAAEAKAAQRGVYGPRPTPPAETPILRHGNIWTHSAQGEAIPLWYNVARGEPETFLPPGLRARIADAYWEPVAEEWWYWVGIDEFYAWARPESITKEEPAAAAQGPDTAFKAYFTLTLKEPLVVYPQPSPTVEPATELPVGTEIQLKRLSWEPTGGTWWYYVESVYAEGWVLSTALGQ